MTSLYVYDVTEYEDVIDSSTVKAEIDFYKAMIEDNDPSVSDEDAAYLADLERLHDEASDNSDDPDRYTLVRYSYAEEFAQDFCDDIYGLDGSEFIYSYIDWGRVAEDIMPVTIKLNGIEYRLSP